jgi:pyruvate dehydrogenase E2 component (dihydrolipoamide acetyltransferase)
MADFLMPALGADMETGKVVQWLVEPGARVKPGDVVAVVETHKGAIDVECFLDGVIGDLVPVGERLPVGAVLARVMETGGKPAVSVKASKSAVSAVAQPASPPLGREAAAPRTGQSTPVNPRRKVSPAARQRALQIGLDPDALSGTGVDGAVVLGDVERAGRRTRSVAAPAAAASAAHRGSFDPVQMRQAIASAMARSKREIPHYYLSSTVDFDAAQAWLQAWNRDRDPVHRLLPAVLLLKATALALREVPQFNGFCEGGVFRPGVGIHVGWATALRGGGLVAPAIHGADGRSPAELMEAMRDLVQRARAGGLRSSELTDPTVTVTSLGDRGAESVLGVIYPPQVAIIGFGRVVERPWVVDGQIVARRLVNLSLAADHRTSDGHLGGQLLAAIQQHLQSPETL